MPAIAKQLVHAGMQRQETLRVIRRFKPLHLPFASLGSLVGANFPPDCLHHIECRELLPAELIELPVRNWTADPSPRIAAPCPAFAGLSGRTALLLRGSDAAVLGCRVRLRPAPQHASAKGTLR